MLSEALRKESELWKPNNYKAIPNNKTGGISPEERDKAVRWLDQLNKDFEFYPETYFLSVSILDRFLSTVKANSKYLRCIAVASFYLAAKTLEEDNVLPSTRELMRESKCGCSVDEIHRMEKCILTKLNWDLRAVTALDFLYIFHALLMSNCPHLLDQFTHMTPSRQMSVITGKLTSCMARHEMTAFSPSTLALSIISLELELFWKDWLAATFTLQRMVQVENAELIQCREMMSRYIKPSQPNIYVVRHPTKRQLETRKGGKPIKRKNLETSDDDDIYDGIKRLYNEENTDPVAPTTKAVTSCGSEMMKDIAVNTALQTVAN